MPEGTGPLLARLRPVLEKSMEAFNRGDFDAAFPLDGDFEFHPDPSVLDRHVVRGRDELIRYFQAARDAFPDWQMEPAEWIEVGETKIVVKGLLGGTGGRSGLDVRTEVFLVYETENAIPVRMYEFFERQAAVEQAGLKD